MDAIQLKSIIWALKFDIQCLKCSKGNEKHIAALEKRIAELRMKGVNDGICMDDK